jgi:DNA-binding MarR family transcriptional regulator
MPSNSSSRFTESVSPETPPPLIGALLRRPLEAVHRHMLERLHQAGFDDLDTAHLPLLQYPGPHGTRPSELAARLRMSKQALNYLLGQLERLGYLERIPDPDDGRSKRISITPRGAELIPVIRGAVAEMEAMWSHQLGPKQFAQLRALLVDLNDHL